MRTARFFELDLPTTRVGGILQYTLSTSDTPVVERGVSKQRLGKWIFYKSTSSRQDENGLVGGDRRHH